MRGVVEKREAGAGAVLEVNDVERGGALVEIVAVAAGIETEERAQEQAIVALCEMTMMFSPSWVRTNSISAGRGAGGDGEAAFATGRSEGVGILFPFERFLGILGFNFLAGQLFPMAVGNFAESFSRLHFKLMRLGQDARRFHVRSRSEA